MKMVCSHINCSPDKKVWLPIVTYVGINLNLKKHPYCKECGIIKNIGGEKSKSIGFYTNVLFDIKEYINQKSSLFPKLTQTQVRLIAKELESNDLFNDQYGTNLNIQEYAFIEEIRKYRPDLTEEFIKGFL